MKLITVMPLYKSMGWIKKTIPVYKTHFSEPLLVVNNSTPEEAEFAKGQGCIVLENNGNKNHGDALDIAARWCRAYKIDAMVAIEPDCLITGRKWYNALVEAMEQNYWMAGLNKEPHGPIRPCPSIWLVSRIQHSFNTVSKGNDVFHSRFFELFDMARLVEDLKGERPEKIRFWLFLWDTALKNWFEIAAKDKAKHVPLRNPDFIHLWHGSKRKPEGSITIL